MSIVAFVLTVLTRVLSPSPDHGEVREISHSSSSNLFFPARPEFHVSIVLKAPVVSGGGDCFSNTVFFSRLVAVHTRFVLSLSSSVQVGEPLAIRSRGQGLITPLAQELPISQHVSSSMPCSGLAHDPSESRSAEFRMEAVGGRLASQFLYCGGGRSHQ